jgi:preprotein translocase subunit SecF
LDIVGKKRWFLTLSAIMVIVGVVFLSIPPRLNLGIDFTSGTSFDLVFQTEVATEDVRSALTSVGHDDAIIQKAGNGEFFIRTRDLGQSGIDEIQSAIDARISRDYTIPSVTSVGQSVAEDTVRNAIIAVVVASIFIMLYVMYAFRSVPRSYRYAIAAIVALGHDVFIVLGLFAILGQVIDAEVNAIFIVGILTVIGYSVHDTIVIFDRIRENVSLAPSRPFSTSVNISINESLARSISTSLTTAMTILALLLFGGETLRDFLIVLLSGVLIGTYSSLFLAAQLLAAWEDNGLSGLIFWRRGDNREAA